MRAIVWISFLLATLPVFGDEVIHKSGKTYTGQIDVVTFRIADAVQKIQRDDIMTVWISAKDEDNVTLRSGERIRGEFVSVSITSDDKPVTLLRSQIERIVIANNSAGDTDRELYVTKKANVPPNDAKAAFDLAKWCSDHAMGTEAKEWAQTSLAIDPNAADAAEAHRLAGDVQFNGEWMSKEDAETARRLTAAPDSTQVSTKPASTEASEQVTPDAEESPGDADAAVDKMPAEKAKAIKLGLAKNNELYKKYAQDAQLMHSNAMKDLKNKYDGTYNSRVATIYALKDQIREQQKVQSQNYSSSRTIMAMGVASDSGGGNKGEAKDDATMQKMKADLQRAQSELTALNSKLPSATEALQKKARDRNKRLSTVYKEFKRAILAGETLNPTDMGAKYASSLSP